MDMVPYTVPGVMNIGEKKGAPPLGASTFTYSSEAGQWQTGRTQWPPDTDR